MVTFINPRGGLGNQMFQIAAAYARAKDNSQNLELLGIKESDEKRPRYWSNMLVNCIPFLVDVGTPTEEWRQPENGVTTYTPIPAGSWRLNGLFQSSRYFAHRRDEIRALFSPCLEVQTMLKYKYADLIARLDNIIVVHARRGDYLSLSHVMTVLEPAYYRAAMDGIAAKMGEIRPHFLLICEEPEFWGSVVKQTDEYTILYEKDEVLTLALMTHFKHFIIANSTFSWWGAWLADAETVYAPANWFGPYGPRAHEDIYEPSWIII
jgi:hypothetical protein